MDSVLQVLLTPVALQVGLCCLITQCALYVVFASSFFGRKSGPWTYMPGFTAHQVIILPILVFLATTGLQSWLSCNPETAVGRLTGQRKEIWAELVMGMLVFWDIPILLLTPALRSPDKIAHHIAMLATAATGLGVFSSGRQVLSYYSCFYFGVVELSTVPLVVVDIFHPNHKPWKEYLLRKDAPLWLVGLNSVARVSFAIAFLLVRTLWWPYVSFCWVLSDVMEVTSLNLPPEERNHVPSTPLYVMVGLNLFFSVLQMYWGTLVARQVIKRLIGTKKKKV